MAAAPKSFVAEWGLRVGILGLVLAFGLYAWSAVDAGRRANAAQDAAMAALDRRLTRIEELAAARLEMLRKVADDVTVIRRKVEAK